MSLEKKLRNMFQMPKKGETYELQTGLVSQYANERKDAIQRTIAAMTLGKDVSTLFPDILKNIATHDIEQKKLVYLYLMNYAKSHPDLCILAVNTFVQDSEDPNPLIRALAIRTMGCIRVDKIAPYLTEPLRAALKDDNPYVRKTAAICVAKLFDLNPSIAIEDGFLSALQGLVGDSNAMVIANAVTALAEIQENNPSTNAFVLTAETLGKLLTALNECTEWGRISILTSLSKYRSRDSTEASHICERVVPQFQHANPSVVLAAIRAVIVHLELLSPEGRKVLLQKMAPSIVSLVSSTPEVQYVALRNIDLILQKYPEVLKKELHVFFCKYNDPSYLKLEKVNIMVRIADEKNVDQLLAELKEYSLEVDVDFVQCAVKAIGECATKVESSVDKCVNVLLDLLATKVNYIVQEVIVVFSNILRRYDGYERIISKVIECEDILEEPEARASFVWIVGQYAESIPQAKAILSRFASEFMEESVSVQLQLLSASIKLFIKRPDDGDDLVKKVLNLSTNECDNPDIRDRAFIYWRILSSGGKLAEEVVTSQRPYIGSTLPRLPTNILNELLSEISSISSVYHKPVSLFLNTGKHGAEAVQMQAIEEQRQMSQEASIHTGGGSTNAENLLDLDFSSDNGSATTSNASGINNSTGNGKSNNLDDLLGIIGSPSSNNTTVPVMGVGQTSSSTTPTASKDIMDLI